MRNQAIVVAILIGLSVFLAIILIAAFAYGRARKKTRSGQEDPDDWLFGHFSEKLYGALFPDQDPDEAAMFVGVKMERYYRSCALTKTAPNPKGLVMDYIYGILILAGCLILSLTVSFAFLFAGLSAFLYLAVYRQHALDARAEEMRSEMADELPRFLDLLQAELSVGLPIDNAIYILCTRMQDSLLAREFLEAMNTMKLGVSDWATALTSMSEKYDIDTLSDFVLNVTTAYRNGVNILDTVTRKTADIKQTHLLRVKEQAGKTTNSILLPITVFQLMPMIVYLIVPALSEIQNGLM